MLQQTSTTKVERVSSSPWPLARPEHSRSPVIAFAVVLDLLLINAAFVTSYLLRYQLKFGPTIPGLRESTRLIETRLGQWSGFEVALSLVVMAVLGMTGIYRMRLGREWVNECFLIGRAVLTAMGILIIFGYLLVPSFAHSRYVIIYTLVLLIIFLSAGKLLTRLVMARFHGSTGWGVRRVLVVGDTAVGKVLMQNLLRKGALGYEVVGFVRGRGDEQMTPFGRFPCLGSVDSIPHLATQGLIDEVIIALPSASHAEIDEIRAHCTEHQVAFKLVPDLFELSLSRVDLDDVAGIPLINVQETALRGANALLKRSLDLIVAPAALLLASPIMAVAALAVRLDSPGPAILRQTRVGKGGQPFTCYKFRTMVQNAEDLLPELMKRRGQTDVLFKDKDDPRRTKVGRVLRKLSIDELPQLWNVLRGEMSLVGPRPPLPREVERYEAWHRKRLEAPPGMTGLWQVSGRSMLPFDEMVVMDLYYIDRWSLGLDLRILVQTLLVVFTSNGAY